MDGQDEQDWVIHFIILLILSIHVNCSFGTAGRGLALPLQFYGALSEPDHPARRPDLVALT
jgi:hypothetical protein